jgi:hypothetical protein
MASFLSSTEIEKRKPAIVEMCDMLVEIMKRLPVELEGQNFTYELRSGYGSHEAYAFFTWENEELSKWRICLNKKAEKVLLLLQKIWLN